MAFKRSAIFKKGNFKIKKKYIFLIIIEFLLIGVFFLFKNAFLRILFLIIIIFLPVLFINKYKRNNKDKSKKVGNFESEYKNFKSKHIKENSYKDEVSFYKNSGFYYNDKKGYKLKRLDNKNINFIIDRAGEELYLKDKEESLKDNKELREKVNNWVEAVNYSDIVFKRIINNSRENMGKNSGECEGKNVEDVKLKGVKLTRDVGKYDMQKETSVHIASDTQKESIKDVENYKINKGNSECKNVLSYGFYKEQKCKEYEKDCSQADNKGYSQVDNKNYSQIDNKGYFQVDNKGYFQVDNKNYSQIDNKGYSQADNKSYSQIDNKVVEKKEKDILPPIELLEVASCEKNIDLVKFNSERSGKKLIDTLNSFGVKAKIINISEGPSVTRYELQPDYGVKVSRIVRLADDIALNLAATSVRIEAPIPGKAAIGIEIPNTEVTPVLLREVIETREFSKHTSKLAFAVGKDIAGTTVIADIATMPHLLIAGATGSGKSVCINTLITSLIYRAFSNEVKFLMIDPKVVELGIYNGIPHLLTPVVTDPKKAAASLNWAVKEMTDRYKLFAEFNVRDLKGYNETITKEGEEALPQIVIIIDELSDLMMVAPNDVEDCICRLAQMARAAGMHLVIATQRPSVNVITGVIKANIPSRISFAVSSQVDSRTIIDMSGAEKLLGKGDMLFSPLGMSKPIRVQGALITDKEIEAIVSFIKSKKTAQYDDNILKEIESRADTTKQGNDYNDELLPQVVNMVIEQGQASTSLIQRKFRLGYSRAARILDSMEEQGIVGPFEGSKPRKVLINKEQWQESEKSD